MPSFKIEDTRLDAPLDLGGAPSMTVSSVPYDYEVTFAAEGTPAEHVGRYVSGLTDPLVLIDRRVRDLHFAGSDALEGLPVLVADATEEYKTVHSAIAAAEFLDDNGATKRGMLVVIGGGIVQDVGAFAAAMFKRGMPWTLVPTTLLSQGDSCIGGKTGLNHGSTKNMMALFSAPRRVVVHAGFLSTLTRDDLLSGLGESLHLCAVGGEDFVEAFDSDLGRWEAGDSGALLDIIVRSLCAKRAVIEADEFERDLRRSMNYGHSIGHALEILTGYRVPHGTAVAVGMLVENEIAVGRGLQAPDVRDRMASVARRLVPAGARAIVEEQDLGGMVEVLARDKKALGATLPLAVPERLGQVRFMPFPLEEASTAVLRECFESVVSAW